MHRITSDGGYRVHILSTIIIADFVIVNNRPAAWHHVIPQDFSKGREIGDRKRKYVFVF